MYSIVTKCEIYEVFIDLEILEWTLKGYYCVSMEAGLWPIKACRQGVPVVWEGGRGPIHSNLQGKCYISLVKVPYNNMQRELFENYAIG